MKCASIFLCTLGSGPKVKSMLEWLLGSGPKVKSLATVLWRQTRGLRLPLSCQKYRIRNFNHF